MRIDRDRPVRERLRVLAGQRLRAGWRTLKIFLRREGMVMNDKRLRRIYQEEKLQVKPRKRRRVRLVRGPVAPPPVALNDEWGLDFMEDRLWTRRKIRALTIEDRLSREGLAVDIDFSLTGRRVTRTLDTIAWLRGYPRRLRIDNGPENCSRAMLVWAVEHDVELHFIDPGKPAQNAWIESFNARVRDEFFNLHSFRTLEDARAAAAAWLTDYNEVRPTAPSALKRRPSSLRSYPRYPRNQQPPPRLLLLHNYYWPKNGARTRTVTSLPGKLHCASLPARSLSSMVKL
jgi:putative transposase